MTVGELARRLGGEVEGDPGLRLVDVKGLAEAGPEHLSFLANRKFLPQLRTTRAGAVLLDRATDAPGRTVIRLDDPYTGFAQALALFHPEPWPEPGIDPRAHVAADAEVGEGATVEAFAWIGPGARVGRMTWIEPGVYVGAGAQIGEHCRLMATSVVCQGCVLGDRVWLNPGAVIGAQGFGFAPGRERHTKIPQVGRALIEDDVEIGANTCVDRATLGETAVRRGAKLDNLVQVGHGSEIGERTLMAGFSGVAGSARLGKGVMLAAQAGAVNHVKIGDGAQLSVQAIAFSDQPAGARLGGIPAIDRAQWLRASAAFARLPELLRRVRALERRIAELEAGRAATGPGEG